MMSYQIQPLDSFRLGRCQLPITCYFCQHDSLHDAPSCRHCLAPLDITRAQNDGRPKPHVLFTVGADHVGKSVFVGTLLDILSRQRDRTEVLTNDAVSIVIQKEVMAALARQEFPPRTGKSPEDWRWAHCRLHQRTRKEPLSVFLADIAGSSILREIEVPGSHPIVTGLFQKANGVYLVIDAARVQQGDKDEEFFAMEFLSYLADSRRRQQEQTQPSDPKTARRSRQTALTLPPVALLLAKADQCPAAFDDPREFVEGQMPGVARACEELLSQYNFFAVSAVGSVASVRLANGSLAEVPLRVEPRGILDPFRWMIRSLSPH